MLGYRYTKLTSCSLMLSVFMDQTIKHIKDNRKNDSGILQCCISALFLCLNCAWGEKEREKERKAESSNETVKYEESFQKEQIFLTIFSFSFLSWIEESWCHNGSAGFPVQSTARHHAAVSECSTVPPMQSPAQACFALSKSWWPRAGPTGCLCTDSLGMLEVWDETGKGGNVTGFQRASYAHLLLHCAPWGPQA